MPIVSENFIRIVGTCNHFKQSIFSRFDIYALICIPCSCRVCVQTVVDTEFESDSFIITKFISYPAGVHLKFR